MVRKVTREILVFMCMQMKYGGKAAWPASKVFLLGILEVKLKWFTPFGESTSSGILISVLYFFRVVRKVTRKILVFMCMQMKYI